MFDIKIEINVDTRGKHGKVKTEERCVGCKIKLNLVKSL